ncbi:MAG: hypothetical protein IPN76_05360 [Saprospiraceae bacterium]|nr:hypothetical protein [Saprospiraceae bacterium]
MNPTFCCLLAAFAAQVVFLQVGLAQVSFQNHTLLTAADGLSETHLNCLVEDAEGFIWLGSKNGLNRYDGHSFRQFFSGTGAGQLRGQNIKCLARYDSLHILVGTDIGIARVQIRNFRITPLVFPAPKHLATHANHVHQMQVQPNGSIWVVTSGGVFLVSADMEVQQSYYFPDEEALAASHLQPSRLLVFPDGKLWVVAPVPTQFSQQAVYEINPAQRMMALLERQPFPDAGRFLSLVQANDTLGLVLYERGDKTVRSTIFNLRKRQFAEVPCKPFHFSNFIPFFSHPEPGKIGLSTKGLTDFYSFDVASQQWEYFPFSQPPILEGVVKSGGGMVLAATGKGLFRISPVNRLFSFKPAIAAMARNKEGELRMMAMANTSSGTAAVSWDGRLVVCDAKTGECRSSLLSMPGANKLSVFSLIPFQGDTLLVASNRGSFWVNTSDGASGRLVGKYKPSFFDTLTAVSLADSQGDIWFGFVQFKGLVRYNPKQKTFVHYPFSDKYGQLFFNEISGLTEDSNGDIWLGWQGGGLAKWVRSADSIAMFFPDLSAGNSFKNNITSMATAPDGRIWMGTAGYGLFAFHPATMRFLNYTRQHGLTHDYVTAVAVDCEGIIWVGSRNGLSRLDPTTGKVYRFFEQHGLPSNHVYVVKAMPDDPCQVFIGGDGGYRLLDVRHFPAPPTGSEIIVNHLKINQIDRPFTNDGLLALDYDENNIEVAFSSLNLLDGYLNEYYYRFSENDKIWKPVGHENILRLTGLQGGRYNIIIRGCVNGGNCFEQQVLRFSIKKPFWKSPLYYGIIGLLIAIITAIYFKLKLNNIMRLQKLRQKISYDLHDDIGSNLSSIQVLTALSKNPNISAEKKTEIADKIKDSAAQVTQSLEEIIWNLHPNNDHFENIQNRLYEQANELLAPKGITLHFNMEADFENLKLGHEKRRELLLLYREALNNTIKYAECTDVWVEMRRQGRLLSLSIRDNGKGFDPAAATGGNGLVTMRYRAENLGGSFSIASEPGKGTVASLDFPAF